ncbi:MAG: CDP-alcohol phosphatidyltransferase [uncultured Frankineae bacterium]|uniref:CDP-alcohol phosphatidyltransferase n=1 Tax=uncultured Frankineae bacterium TaxID=437475 RepID=A0A6J4L183_9ACTN|nr:MAG: CDP-alcohol phosphatidyltransferase [uncultured Frankineae bacterium]
MTRGQWSLLALAVLGLALLVLALVTARRPAQPVPDRDGYFDRWSTTHGGYDPRTGSVWVRGWLSIVLLLARPLARRGVQPDVVTYASLWLALLVLALSGLGGGWAVLAGVLVVASALLDSLDGGLAVLEDRQTSWGYVLDSVVDRCSDVVWVLAAVAVGCPLELALAVVFGVFLLEYLRARAGNAGFGEVGTVTVAERPTRVIVLAPTLALCGALPAYAGVVSVVGPAVLLGLTAVGVGQLGVVVRRALG